MKMCLSTLRPNQRFQLTRSPRPKGSVERAAEPIRWIS